MNVYHWVLIGIYSLAFIITLYKHGELKTDLYFNAKSTFWVALIEIVLVILSAKS